MKNPKINVVHRCFTDAERLRFERAKREVAEELPEITERSRRVLDEMEATFAAMQLLKAEREKRGVTLAELSQRTGIDKSNLSKLENDINANPTLETLMRIARALGGTIEFSFRSAA